jgi:hypothetical protein
VWTLHGSYGEKARGHGNSSLPIDSKLTLHEDGTFEYADLGSPIGGAPRIYSGHWNQSRTRVELDWDDVSLLSFAEHHAGMHSPGDPQPSYRMDSVHLQGKLVTTNGRMESTFGG